MEIKIRCSECNRYYFCLRENTKMRGPIIETVCPYCKKEIIRNMSAFLEKQTVHIDNQLCQASTMISLGRIMEELIGNEEAYKKKKK